MSKYSKYTGGQKEALLNMLGGEDKMDALLCGDLTVELKEAVKLLFDKNGRLIPRNLQSSVCDANKDFYLEHSAVDLPKLIKDWEMVFEQKFPISLDELENRSVAILDLIKNDPLLNNCLNGFWAVTLVPKIEVVDYGTILEKVFLPATERGYKAVYPDRTFVNYRKGTLANQVKIVNGTRHEKLIEQLAKDNVVVVHFVNPTQGFSVNAQREVMGSMPLEFTLGGPIDRLTVAATYPNIVFRDFNTPGYDCSAVSWQSADQSLYLWADDVALVFGNGGFLGDAYDYCSGGLSVLG